MAFTSRGAACNEKMAQAAAICTDLLITDCERTLLLWFAWVDLMGCRQHRAPSPHLCGSCSRQPQAAVGLQPPGALQTLCTVPTPVHADANMQHTNAQLFVLDSLSRAQLEKWLRRKASATTTARNQVRGLLTGLAAHSPRMYLDVSVTRGFCYRRCPLRLLAHTS